MLIGQTLEKNAPRFNRILSHIIARTCSWFEESNSFSIKKIKGLFSNKMRGSSACVIFLLFLCIGKSIQKLNFVYENDKYIIRAKAGADIGVRLLKFHTGAKPELDRNAGYYGFTRYEKGQDFGTVYIVKDVVINATTPCPCRNTAHARAFRSVTENKCPSEFNGQENIIASGFCYRWAPFEDGKWGFDSVTFNSVRSIFSENSYLNRLYHDDDEKTIMHPDEQAILRYCMKEWLVKDYNDCFASNARHAPRPRISLTCDGCKPALHVTLMLLTGLLAYCSNKI
ncbi:unnamed protein product [Owenia fusiformis]|uniref:Uncharacterized protein n=1 Tax=Owenia fusiformis TaxID=6347 RepID=A0A8J1THF4_OWEFU|nr:unnamed protein product [Owenia fusiformis]